MTPEELKLLQLEQLKEAAKIFLKPMERLPFPVVIEAMTGKEVLPVLQRPEDLSLLAKLSQACIEAVVISQQNPIAANRANDVSTLIEKLLEVTINKTGLKCECPRPLAGRVPGGYPDRLVWQADKPTYLEVKVSREQNMDQGSARNFFYQPTANTKIIHSARHLLAGFAVREISEKSWILVNWKLVDLWFLRVKLKPEYNADNLEIYRHEAILLKGDDREVTYRKTN
jgi:hypothetical protein